MLNEATLEYISRHKDDDVRGLALRGCKDTGVDLTLALQQIAGRQTARRKLPSWAALDGIVYPPHLNMEQCSSELTARYKAKVVSDLCSPTASHPSSLKLLDLTGGFGVDFAFMSEAFTEAVYVERDAQLCTIAAHNFVCLGKTNVKTVCTDAETFLSQASPSGEGFIVFLDPARRDTHGSRTYALADCTPNVITLMPALLQKARFVMLKLSPMLDWRKAVEDLGPQHVKQVHIVAVDNECKELLIVLTPKEVSNSHESHEPLLLVCADIHSHDGSSIIYTPGISSSPPPFKEDQEGDPSFLYEPNAAVMKAGCFRELAADFGITPLAANSHLFIADRLIDGFPGRRFRIEDTCTMNRRELQATVGHLRQANIAVRNFPLTTEQLRRRLKLADGGTAYIFASTLADGTHTLFLCSKC